MNRNSNGTWKYDPGMEPHRCPNETQKQFEERVARQEAQYQMLLDTAQPHQAIDSGWHQAAADAAAAR